MVCFQRLAPVGADGMVENAGVSPIFVIPAKAGIQVFGNGASWERGSAPFALGLQRLELGA